ncbi:dTDP-4-dehydrorhamnose 3,5-epimerase family protein [Cystobacter fuscus]|nr:dTDP-4-dehydrorhamnose 3,5-epimerase family protein [Cystobacter fuscus]
MSIPLNSTEALPIKGLHWQPRWRMNNGQDDSFVVPFPTNNPANIVFHGHKNFDYGHFGIHLGQEDRLTFMGPENKLVRADFVDCRAGSETLHRRLSITFQPGTHRTLIIPPGVAHTFFGLEDVYTINEYGLFLPDPRAWVNQQTSWTIGNDIMNFGLETPDDKLPVVTPNTFPASEKFYTEVLRRQQAAIPALDTEFPMTRDLDTEGKKVRVVLRKRVEKKASPFPEWEEIQGIEGVGWQRHLTVLTGDESGIVPLAGPAALYVVDHGEKNFTHDSFGIHLGQEDRLTFVGPKDQLVTLHLLDCRSGSKTLHKAVDITFLPDPRRFLLIPPGVAHAFRRLENVFTINRPRNFLKADGSYRPGSDVIDWPVERTPYPVLEANTIPADEAFYRQQAIAQKDLSKEKVRYDTPKVQVITDPKTGKQFRVALRRRVDAEEGPTSMYN